MQDLVGEVHVPAVPPASSPASGVHHTITVRGHTINFYIYVSVSGSADKVRRLEPFFSRLPDQHLGVLYPVFVMNKKPGGRQGGGTWRSTEVPTSFMRAGHVRNTGIPSADIQRLVIDTSQGMIGLSKDRWQRPDARLKFSVFHEVGHCVDYSFQPGGLVPSGATAADFPGMATDRCGAGNRMVRRAVEAYARYICSPSRIYHSATAAERAAFNRRLIDTMRRSRAFRSVPAEWHP